MAGAESLIETIRNAIIGDDVAMEGPFGARRITYADYTASGRSLAFIEDFIRSQVLPSYANIHTETSFTGAQTTRFREGARRIIRQAVGATEDDAVIFCGSGATGAVNKMIEVLNLRIPADLDRRYQLRDAIPRDERPVVFVGPYEHHSNEVPWRESICDVVIIDEDMDGLIDQKMLEAELVRYANRTLKIGSFSAASNVTGIGSRTWEVSSLLHRHGALAFWDFAAAGPYVQLDMNARGDGPDGHLLYKDAMFLSPHKFIGGPGTPGILVCKKRLLRNTVPSVPGGGTVCYVSARGHRYVRDHVSREEGGTPAIVESIRAGLVFQLKEAVGAKAIQEHEEKYIRRAIDCWDADLNLRVLGNTDAWRLSIVSFMVRHGQRYLHHSYVVALLNDLFGIQARGGWSCAGPYGHRLLGIDLTTSDEFDVAIDCGFEGIKPGWIRVNFNYFISEAVFSFLLQAVQFVAAEGWKLLPLYKFDPVAARWTHRNSQAVDPMKLSEISYQSGRMEFESRRSTAPESALRRYLEEAPKIVAAAVASYATVTWSDPPLSPEVETLRWFPTAAEVLDELRGETPEAPLRHTLNLRA